VARLCVGHKLAQKSKENWITTDNVKDVLCSPIPAAYEKQINRRNRSIEKNKPGRRLATISA
jgi:hypothetical protein